MYQLSPVRKETDFLCKYDSEGHTVHRRKTVNAHRHSESLIF